MFGGCLSAQTWGGLVPPSFNFGRKVLASLEAKSGGGVLFLPVPFFFFILFLWETAQHDWNIDYRVINPSPAEQRYTLPLQTVLIQINSLLKKPLFVIKYVTLYQAGSSNLISWKLELARVKPHLKQINRSTNSPENVSPANNTQHHYNISATSWRCSNVVTLLLSYVFAGSILIKAFWRRTDSRSGFFS